MATVKVAPDKRKIIGVIPKELDDQIRRDYVRKQRDVSNIIKEALELYIEKHPKKPEATA